MQQMVDFHRENEADVTVAALPVPLAEATAFGVIGTSTDMAGCASFRKNRPIQRRCPAIPPAPTPRWVIICSMPRCW